MYAGKRCGVRDRASGRGRERGVVHDGAGHAYGESDLAGGEIVDQFELARRMQDIIDVDTGSIIEGETTIQKMGEEILDYVVQVASGEVRIKAEIKAQEDFIPWKRGVSL